MAPLLELDGVDARYGGVRALHGVSLTVDDGESVAILGANGAGKTSTLRAISGTVRRSGRIVFNGKEIGKKSPEAVARLGIAHVPEGREIYAELTVWENLLIGANHRSNWREAKRDCENVAGLLPRSKAGATSRRDTRAVSSRCSRSGARSSRAEAPAARRAVARARADDRARLLRLVSSLTHEMGLTVLVVEQNAGTLASTKRAYVLEVGRVVLEGESESSARTSE